MTASKVAGMPVAVPEDFSRVRLEKLLLDGHAVLRHDVDYDPACAYEMAKLEQRLGVRSTFYIRPLDEYPSVSSAQYFFEGIAETGMELAPHVDLFLPRHAKVADAYMAACAEQDFVSLSGTLPVVRKVSFHAPPRDVYWRPVDGFYHALDREWFGMYVADSRGRFKFSPEKALGANRGLVSLNLHPCWWFWSPEKVAEWQILEAAKP